MMATVLLVALVQQPASPADTTAGRPCKMIIDSVGRQAQQVEVRRGGTNAFAGGGGLGPFEGASSTPPPHSVAWFARVKRVDLLRPKKPLAIPGNPPKLHTTPPRPSLG